MRRDLNRHGLAPCMPMCVCAACDAQDENSTITLDSVAYMSSGPFALNLWVALETSQSSSGLRWVYSHTNGDHIAVGFPNQVCSGGLGETGCGGLHAGREWSPFSKVMHEWPSAVRRGCL